MRTQSHISAVALAAALLTIPQAAQAQLDIGVDLGGNGSGGLGLGVDVGIGDTNIGVGAGVGGNSLVDANVGIGSGSGSGSSGSGSGGVPSNDVLNIDLGVGTDDALVDLDADVLGTGGVGADVEVLPTQSDAPSAPSASSEPLVGVRVSALSETVRLDALVDLINQPNLAETDLDAVIDDRAVSIITVTELLGEDNLAEVSALIDTGGTGREELLAAIDASVTLGSILDREGVERDDVLALYIGAGGETEVVVLDATIDLALGAGADGPILSNDLAELDIDLLSDDELAEIDLALLPNEEQRLDAIIRLLGSGGGTPSGGTVGAIDIIDLDALLGDQSLAELDGVLSEDELVLSADLLDFLDDQGLSPEAVVAVRSDENGETQLFVDLGLGDIAQGNEGGLSLDNLADLDIDLLTDEELAQINLALLPNEEQRLDALIRILGNNSTGSGPTGGTGGVDLVDLELLLNQENLADLEATIGEPGAPLTLSAEVLDALNAVGLAPEAVVAIRSNGDGGTQVFFNAGLGGMDVAAVDVELGGTGTDGTGTGGTGTGGTNGTGGTGTGDTGTGGTGSGGTGTGGNGTGTGGTGTGNGGSGSGGTGSGSTGGGSGSGGTGLVSNSGALTSALPAAVIAVETVVANVACEVGVGTLSTSEPAGADDVRSVRSVELVRLEGCVQTLSQGQVAVLRQAVEANAALTESVEEAGLVLDNLVGGNVEGSRLTLYFDTESAPA